MTGSTRLFDCALAIAIIQARVGIPPTIAEVSNEMGLRGVHASPHVAALIANGYAERKNGNRSLRLTAAGIKLINGNGRQKGR